MSESAVENEGAEPVSEPGPAQRYRDGEATPEDMAAIAEASADV
jgi:hypothetical protein